MKGPNMCALERIVRRSSSYAHSESSRCMHHLPTKPNTHAKGFYITRHHWCHRTRMASTSRLLEPQTGTDSWNLSPSRVDARVHARVHADQSEVREC